VIASLVAFSIDIVLQEPLVQLGKVVVLFIWKLGNDSARAIVVASVAARAGIDVVQQPRAVAAAAHSNSDSLPDLEIAATSDPDGSGVSPSGAGFGSISQIPMPT